MTTPLETYESERRAVHATKWSAFDKKFTPLWVADMDFAVSPAIQKALAGRIDHPTFGYTSIDQSVNFAVTEWAETHYDWRVAPSEIIWMQGLVPGFCLILEMLTTSEQAIAIPTPNYPPILNVGKTIKRHTVSVKHRFDDNRWSLDFDHLESVLRRPDVRCLLLANPANPLGFCLTRDEVSELAMLARKHNVIVCSDEIHCDLVFDNHHHIPLGSVLEENSITMMAASKTFNIAGLNTSYAIVPDPVLRTDIAKAVAARIGYPNLLGITATKAALTQGEPWRQQLLAQLDQNRQLMHSFLVRESYEQLYLPQATHLYWIKQSADQWVSKNIMPSKGQDFGDSNYTRINFACSQALLSSALSAMASDG